MNWNNNLTGKMALLALLLGILAPQTSGQVTLKYEQNITPTWQETIHMYRWLDEQYPSAKLTEAGETDAGKPLHLFIISADGYFTPESAREAGKQVLMINNGIHPGEPCGVDASLKLASELLSGEDPYSAFLENTVVLIVPMFNVGGALNRGRYHRANQNGPLEHGFRGNARNLDLNRDFIKLDTRNARSLVRIMRAWEPDLFADTHTTNGADYPYVITLINSHHQRLEPALSGFMEEEALPFLFSAMEKTPYEMSPYVWSLHRSPEEGVVGFMDYPRYTSGYASLYNTLAFTIETHMFKPYRDRVLSSWHLLREMVRFSHLHGEEMAAARKKAWEEKLAREHFVLEWELDTTRYDTLNFRGYRAKTRASQVTGGERMYFDRNDPWQEDIPYYRYFRPVVSCRVPDYYLVPAAYGEVVDRLKLNGVRMERVDSDTFLHTRVQYIESYQTADRAYNGHYRHSRVRVRDDTGRVLVLQGDVLIPVRQKAIEYLVQSLEPEGFDSFFSWNFFDAILSRNEYFSPYIFEDTALQLLKDNPDLAARFAEKKRTDTAFASSPRMQFSFMYANSPWSEAPYMRYPVLKFYSGYSPTDSSTE